MKLSKVLLSGAVVAMMSSSAFAAADQGQKIYLKVCKSCHGNGTKGAAMSTQKGWDAWFAGDAKKLVEKHTKDAKANAYFTNPAFKGHSKHLHDFLKEYASDSGNVPSCG